MDEQEINKYRVRLKDFCTSASLIITLIVLLKQKKTLLKENLSQIQLNLLSVNDEGMAVSPGDSDNVSPKDDSPPF